MVKAPHAIHPGAGGQRRPDVMSRGEPLPAYVVSARRTALGRVGGLHRSRRIEDLTAPLVTAVLADAKVAADDVDELILGNTTAGGNPARLVALSAGLPERVAAMTVDRQCGSGLDAILLAIRHVAAGESEVVVAGGAESVSTAPWRIAKPKSLYQLPHFMAAETAAPEGMDPGQPFESAEHLAKKLGIGRSRQDAWVLKSHARAAKAREDRRFVGEILPLRANAEEARDQSAIDPSADEIERQRPYVPPKGTLTPGNTTAPHDGAALVLVVSERVWTSLGRPPALRLLASAVAGVGADEEAAAPLVAMKKLHGRLNGFDRSTIRTIEVGETSAAQAIAFAEGLDLDPDQLNRAGGAVVRGHPLGAAGAVLAVRVFTELCRNPNGHPPFGAVAQGTIGGLGIAALFEAVGTPTAK